MDIQRLTTTCMMNYVENKMVSWKHDKKKTVCKIIVKEIIIFSQAQPSTQYIQVAESKLAILTSFLMFSPLFGYW